MRMYESSDTQNVGIINSFNKGLYTQGCMYIHHVYFILILNKIYCQNAFVCNGS